MPAPNSSVAICNLALDLLKQEDITSIETPVTDTEVICERWYDQTRREVLRKHPWNFAIKRRSLPLASEAPAFEYSNAYNLPNDFIRLLTLGETVGKADDLIDYQVEDGQILIDNNDNSLAMRYIYDIQDVNKFDALFIRMLSYELALNMSYKFTEGNTRIAAIQELLEIAENQARSIDGQERPTIRRQRNRFVRARIRNTRISNKFVDFN